MIDIKNKKLPCKFEMIRMDKSMPIDKICYNYHISQDRLIYSRTHLSKGDIVLIAYPDCMQHIVMPMQTIEDIASKYNVTKEYVLTKNNCHEIFIGQILYI